MAESADDVIEREVVTPEDALDDVRAQLAESERRAAEERTRREAAEAQAAQAGNFAQNASTAALEASLAAAEQSLTAARSAYRQAREGGDVDAEMVASEQIASSRVRVDALKVEKGRLAQQAARPTPQQQPQPGQSAEARAWISNHPRFNSDPVYKGTAEGAHFDALRRGMIESSPAYFDHIERVLTQQYGENHGSTEAMAAPPPQRSSGSAPRHQGGRPPASSFATPGSRGNTNAPRDSADPTRIAAEISALGDSTITADQLKEFASACNMTLEEYCKSQAKILAERKAGRSGGLGADVSFR